mgnify:CR=1 FL=1
MKNISVIRLFILVTLLLLNSIFRIYSQPAESSRALKYFDKAREYYEKGEWEYCSRELDKAIEADSTFADAYIMKGDLFLEKGQPELAIGQYSNSLRFNPKRQEIVWNLLANTLFSMERYAEAEVYYEKILESPGISVDWMKSIENKIITSKIRADMQENPVSFDPVNLGAEVNTSADEYINAMSADGSGIYFTRRIKNSGDQPRDFIEDFYFAPFVADTFQHAMLLKDPPGRQNDAGAICISADGRLIFFTACHRTDSYGSCDVYYSEKVGETWSVAKNLGPLVNAESWDTQPSISPDGKTLYFTSNRPGGFGGSDIWKTERGVGGEWGKPVNLGPQVNTTGSEMAPFIHFDNQTLYFSSDGHQGMGGADLFKTEFHDDIWTTPVNLGYPINSSSDELIIIVNPEGINGFISSNDLNGEGGYDIYKFELDQAIRPVPVSYLKGKVFDAADKKPLHAGFELIDIEKDSLIISAMSDLLNGQFLVCVPSNRNYALNVSCPGYLFYSDHFPLSEIKSSMDPVIKDIPLEKISEGNKMILKNIFFNTDEYQLKAESYPELDKLYNFLEENPSVKIEVGGHTDDQGEEAYNQELSLKRARAVTAYLAGRGIAQERMTFKGYGENDPVDSNETNEGRANNRRTEITVLGSD